MTDAEASNGASNGPHISWSLAIAIAMIFMSAAGGGWTIFQTQFHAIELNISTAKGEGEKSWTIFQAQIDRRFGEINTQLPQTIRRVEFDQFVVNIYGQLDILRKQIAVLEQTRPTTGELQASSRGIDGTVGKIEERVRALEAYWIGQSHTPFQTKQGQYNDNK